MNEDGNGKKEQGKRHTKNQKGKKNKKKKNFFSSGFLEIEQPLPDWLPRFLFSPLPFNHVLTFWMNL